MSYRTLVIIFISLFSLLSCHTGRREHFTVTEDDSDKTDSLVILYNYAVFLSFRETRFYDEYALIPYLHRMRIKDDETIEQIDSCLSAALFSSGAADTELLLLRYSKNIIDTLALQRFAGRISIKDKMTEDSLIWHLVMNQLFQNDSIWWHVSQMGILYYYDFVVHNRDEGARKHWNYFNIINTSDAINPHYDFISY